MHKYTHVHKYVCAHVCLCMYSLPIGLIQTALRVISYPQAPQTFQSKDVREHWFLRQVLLPVPSNGILEFC